MDGTSNSFSIGSDRGPTPLSSGGGDIANWSPEWLREQHQIQQAVNAQLMNGLQQLLNRQEETGGAAASTETPISMVGGGSEASRRAKHSQPHPTKYNGEDRTLYPAFKGQLRAKLEIDQLAIGGDKEMVWYSYGCLTGKAATRIYPWLDANSRKSIPLRIDSFFEQMDAAFLDPQIAQNALKWINSARQRTTPFRDFLYEFESKLLEAGGWEFSDEIRIGYLQEAVSVELKRVMVTCATPRTYLEYVDLVRRTSDNLENLKQIERTRQRYRHQQDDNKSPKEDKMDWESTSRTSSGRTPNRKPARWVTPDVLEQRRKDKECLRCGSHEHFIVKCHLGPAKPPTTGLGERKTSSSTNTRKTKVTSRVEEISESEDTQSDSDSGKE
jgi:hypothetical protein